MTSVDTGSLRQMFRDEAEERLDSMVSALLSLERGAEPAEPVTALFRDAHTIKGGAGMLGLAEVHTIAADLEERLAAARDAGRFDPSLIETTLRDVDALREAVAGREARTGEPVAPTAPAITAAPPPPPQPLEHEHRSVRVDTAKIDRLLDMVGETVLHHKRVTETVAASDETLAESLPDGGDLLVDELQDAVLRLRMLPFSAITGSFPRAVRDVGVAEGKEVELVVEGGDTQLDRAVLDGAAEMIGHLLRNAVAHGIELPEERTRAGKPRVGRITLRAEPRGGRVAILVSDDGRGVDRRLRERVGEERDLADVLAEPGVSTAEAVTDTAGRGVGLDAVRAAVEKLGGEVEVTTEPGRGTAVTLLVPLSLAVLHVLVVDRAGTPLGIPVAVVERVVAVHEPESLGGRRAVHIEGDAVPLTDPVAALGGPEAPMPPRVDAVVVAAGGRRVALGCDRVHTDEEVLVKPLGALLARVPGYLGGAIMHDGRIALIVDPVHLASRGAHGAVASAPQADGASDGRPTILVVDDQFTVRELQRSILEASGYQVRTARDGREAWELVTAGEPCDLIVTDLEMPEMDGLELLESVRRLPDRSNLPVVVVTSRASDEDQRRGLEAGADAYIVKESFDQRVLLDTVARLVPR